MKENVYISFSKCTEIKNEKIRISDVADVWCRDNKLLSQLKAVVIGKVDGGCDRVLSFSVISIIQILEQKFLNISVVNIGEPEFLVSYRHKKKKCVIWNVIKIIFVCGIVFCGGAFAMHPTSISELFAVADAGRLMPPKSTWFEPKLRSGLFIHEIER